MKIKNSKKITDAIHPYFQGKLLWGRDAWAVLLLDVGDAPVKLNVKSCCRYKSN